MQPFQFDDDYLTRLKNHDPDTKHHFKNYVEALLAKDFATHSLLPHDLFFIWQMIYTQAIFHTVWLHPIDDKEFREFIEGVCAAATRRYLSEHLSVGDRDISHNFKIVFDSRLSPEQVKGTLNALANFYRGCGGVGLQIEFQVEEVPTLGHVHV